ncbi:MAG: helix-turn-helix transcriptional regulator [Planctomycetota bacterium]|jgi:excisionase family DNA binding protein
MQLMSIEDLAAYLGDSKRTIYKYIASGDCPPYIRISAKNIKFDRADVDAWLEAKKIFPVCGGKEMSNVKLVDYAKGIVKKAVGGGNLPWTPRAQAMLERAEKQAAEEGADLVGSGHILFGMVSVEECLGATVLEDLGVTPAMVCERYEQLGKPSGKKGAGKAKFSEEMDKTIRCACEQAVAWGHEYIGAEHLLVGILGAGRGLGFQILTDLGITLEKVGEETGRLIVCHNTPTERKEK